MRSSVGPLSSIDRLSTPGLHSWPELLSTKGIAAIEPAFSPDMVEDWNARLNPLFAAQASEGRAYVGADNLVELGVLTGCLSPAVRALVTTVTPDAVAYHAHAYEIDANQRRPHIRAGRLNGWHRDEETIRAYRPGRPSHLSLFVYLTDVGRDDGAFELCPEQPGRTLRTGRPVVIATGPAGTGFVWNRSYAHRASPNQGPIRRRLLKLSWQPRSLANDRISGAELTRARERATAAADPWLLGWLGGPRSEDRLPVVEAAPPRPVAMPPEGEVRVTRLGQAVDLAWSLRHLVPR